ncbi:MAG: efflux RND transporter periplasmic adaptor subunit [Ferruginibacter sp.]
MKQIKTLGLIITAFVVLASCGGSKKDGDAAINDVKTKLEKAKKEKAGNESTIKELEAKLLLLDSNTANASKVKLVSILSVTAQKFEHFIDLQGKVDAEDISYITPRMGPAQVKAIFVKQGQFVKKGQLLLKLDDAIMRQSVVATKQQLEGIKTQLSYAKNIYGRQKNLWDQGIGTEVQLIAAKTNVAGLENQLATAGEQVKTMEAQLNTSNVYSDVTGIADIVAIRVGEIFSGMSVSGPQIKIVNTSALKVVTNVPENYLTRMHAGTSVLISIPDAQKVNIPSVLSVISQSVDPTSRGFLAEAKIPYNAALKPNQTAIIKIKDYSADNAIVIPVNMVQTDEKGKYVYIMIKGSNAKTIAKKVTVLLGEVYGDNVEIKSGLTGGEQLITEGYQGLYEGQAVSTGTK